VDLSPRHTGSGPLPPTCRLQKELGEDRSVVLVAEAGGSARGVEGLVLVWCIADEAQFLEIAVHPKAQCRGIGTRLMSGALALSTRSPPLSPPFPKNAVWWCEQGSEGLDISCCEAKMHLGEQSLEYEQERSGRVWLVLRARKRWDNEPPPPLIPPPNSNLCG